MTVKHRRTQRAAPQSVDVLSSPRFSGLLPLATSVYLTLGGTCTASLQVEVDMDRPTGNRLLTTRLLTADC